MTSGVHALIFNKDADAMRGDARLALYQPRHPSAIQLKG